MSVFGNYLENFLVITANSSSSFQHVFDLTDRLTGIFKSQSSDSNEEENIGLPEMSTSQHVFRDYSSTSLSLKAHPVSFARKTLFNKNVLATNELNLWQDGRWVKVAGIVLVRQPSDTASGIVFITIEDETGAANLVVFKHVFEKYRKEITQSKLLMVSGKLQREGEVTHVVAKYVYDLSKSLLNNPSNTYQNLPRQTQGNTVNAVQGNLFPSRDFK